MRAAEIDKPEELKVIQIDRYMCAYCGKEYKSREEAYICANSHKIPDWITKYYFGHGDEIPSEVEFTFRDGQTVRYRREAD